MSDWKRERGNPIAFFQRWYPDFTADNVTFDPNLRKGDYSINRRQSTDGTLALTLMQIEEILLLLTRRESFYRRNPPDMERLRDIRYIIGPMRIATVFGKVVLGCSNGDETKRWPGQREGFRMPVKVEYLYDGPFCLPGIPSINPHFNVQKAVHAELERG